MEYTIQNRKFWKFKNICQNTKSFRRNSTTALEVFWKDFVNISYEDTSFLILEHTNCYQIGNKSCWMLNVSQTASYEITLVCLSVCLPIHTSVCLSICLLVHLSVCLSVIKFSQDWIISFFVLYMIADHGIKWLTIPDFWKKKVNDLNLAPTVLNQA